MPDRPKRILFTGFEPSGDDHASAVISRLRERHPELEMFAWGGPKMGAAGATIVERTGKDAVMGVPGIGKILEHQRINQRVREWIADNPIDLHVPVDSPAANFPICAIAKRAGAKVVHLVAPQVWAWGPWRVKKLRRLTDFVCCLLPFEERYFTVRGVPARFVGHPIFDKAPDEADLEAVASDWPQNGPRIALMPGSRPAELRKNFPLLLEAFRTIKRRHPTAEAVVAAASEDAEASLRELAGLHGGWPEGVPAARANAEAVARWADLALVVSGTVTLQVARQQTPMVVVYRSSRLLYHLVARWLVRTPMFCLPNLLASRRIVPELIPHFDGPEPIAAAALRLLSRPEIARQQQHDLGAICELFAGHCAADEAAGHIARILGIAVPRAAEPAIA